MADKVTLRQVEAARDAHANNLARLGAHAVGIELTGLGWAVVAHVEPGAVFEGPAKLSVRLAGKVFDVPLKVLRNEVAKPE